MEMERIHGRCKRHIKEMDNVYYVGRGFSGHGEITVRSNVRR